MTEFGDWQSMGTAPKMQRVLVDCEAMGVQVGIYKPFGFRPWRWRLSASETGRVLCPRAWMPLPKRKGAIE